MNKKKIQRKKRIKITENSVFIAHIFIVMFAFVGLVWNTFSEIWEVVKGTEKLKPTIAKKVSKTTIRFGDSITHKSRSLG